MEKRCISVLLSFVFMAFCFFPFSSNAHADALSAFAIGGMSYAIGAELGFDFAFVGGTQNQVEVWMNNNLDDYVSESGSTYSDLFGDLITKDLAGKIVVGAATYNGICDFLGWLKDKYDLSGNLQSLAEMINEYTLDRDAFKDDNLFTFEGWTVYDEEYGAYWQLAWKDENGTISGSRASVSHNSYPIQHGYKIRKSGTRILIATATYENVLGSITTQAASHTFSNTINSATVSGSYIDSGFPTAINPSKAWQGTVGGQEWPDKTLDQIFDQIYHDVSENDLVVEGQIVDVAPEPTIPPTPAPTYPPAEDILSGVNTVIAQGNDNILAIQEMGLDIGGMKQGIEDLNDLTLEQKQILEEMGIDIGGMKQGIEDLNDLTLEQKQILEDMGIDIGGMAEGLDDLNDLIIEQNQKIDVIEDGVSAIPDAIQSQSGVISGAIDQAVSDVGTAIGNQTGVISGAIDQAVSDVQTAIGEQTAALDESLSATAEGVETIAEAIEDEAINWQKFDLRGLFPFCIPFDIYNMLKALDASPTAPHVQLPFVIQSIGFSYMLDLDFSAFDPVAAIMRQMELICYGLALAWATSKVIKW